MISPRASAGLVLLAALPGLCSGSIYPVSEILSRGVPKGIKETPMFKEEDNPAWFFATQKPYIRLEGTLSTEEGFPANESNDGYIIRVIHAWSASMPDLTSILDIENYASCSDTPSDSDFDQLEIKPVVIAINDVGKKKIDLNLEFDIKETAWHVIIVTSCITENVVVEGDITFMNPYGYLNGWAYGILPLNIFLCFFYGTLLIAFTVGTLRNREHVLMVQYAIIAVCVMGFVERLTWAITYIEMNATGGRACCPVRGDLTFSITLAVFKRASCVLLLLSVCLGFGVVKPRLSKITNLKILLLGVFYTISSLNLELEKVADISTNGKQTDPMFKSSLIVSVCDVTILFWIFYAISESLKDLQEAGQIAKLSLYQTLARSLIVWVMVWFGFTLTEVLTLQGKIDLPWRYWYILASFWDIFFLGILLQISYLWRPSPMTAQYAFSHQLPTSDDLDEFDQIGIEVGGPESAEDFVIQGDSDSDSEDEFTTEAAAPKSKEDKIERS